MRDLALGEHRTAALRNGTSETQIERVESHFVQRVVPVGAHGKRTFPNYRIGGQDTPGVRFTYDATVRVPPFVRSWK